MQIEAESHLAHCETWVCGNLLSTIILPKVSCLGLLTIFAPAYGDLDILAINNLQPHREPTSVRPAHRYETVE